MNIEKIKKSSPIIICGAHGGGTSFTTKMLRHSGLFVGSDVEPFEQRKFHESASFRTFNIFAFSLPRISKQIGRETHNHLQPA